MTISQELKTFIEEKIPFNRYLGIRIGTIRKGFCRFEVPFRDEFIGDPFRPALHGGVISTLIDACGGAAVWTEVNPSTRVSTVDLRVDYLLPGPLKDIACEATVVRIGNRVGVVDMAVFPVDDREMTVAVGKGVYNIKRGGIPVQLDGTFPTGSR